MSGDALAYANTLSFLEERRSSVPIVALAANGGVLAMRIKRLLGYREPQPYSWLATATLVAVGIGATALCLGTFAGAQSNPTKQSLANGGAGSQTLSAPYQQWVDEDVLWIITPKERGQFMALSTNDERDEFIRQFWQRRDAGIPGVDANPFRKASIIVAWPMQTSTSRPVCRAGRQIGDVFTLCMGRHTLSRRTL